VESELNISDLWRRSGCGAKLFGGGADVDSVHLWW